MAVATNSHRPHEPDLLAVFRQHLAAAGAEPGTVLPQAGQHGHIPLIQHASTMAPRISPAGALLRGRAPPAVEARPELRASALRVTDFDRAQQNDQRCEGHYIRHLVLLDR